MIDWLYFTAKFTKLPVGLHHISFSPFSILKRQSFSHSRFPFPCQKFFIRVSVCVPWQRRVPLAAFPSYDALHPCHLISLVWWHGSDELINYLGVSSWFLLVKYNIYKYEVLWTINHGLILLLMLLLVATSASFKEIFQSNSLHQVIMQIFMSEAPIMKGEIYKRYKPIN